jgi:hypothetical protein
MRTMEFLKIILLCIAAAVVYGILQDQVTARVCVEYFTIGHPPIFDGTEDPTLLAFGWGVLATWWVGLFRGSLLAVVARAGSRPKLRARDLIKPVIVTMACVGVAALVVGLLAFFVAQNGYLWLVGPLAEEVPADKHVAFLTDAWAHLAAYGAGALVGGATCVRVWMKRGRGVSS